MKTFESNIGKTELNINGSVSLNLRLYLDDSDNKKRILFDIPELGVKRYGTAWLKDLRKVVNDSFEWLSDNASDTKLKNDGNFYLNDDKEPLKVRDGSIIAQKREGGVVYRVLGLTNDNKLLCQSKDGITIHVDQLTTSHEVLFY